MGLTVIECEADALGPTMSEVGVAVIGGPLPAVPWTVTRQSPVPVWPAESVTTTVSGGLPPAVGTNDTLGPVPPTDPDHVYP